MKNKLSVIALGGSIMYPDHIDTDYLKAFKKFIERLVKRGHKFIIVTGGGRLARVYQEAASKVAKLTDEDKDWLGIHATRSNAHLLRTVFRDIADPVVIDERHKIKKITYPVTVASGWTPGWSTDYISIALAEDFKVPTAIIAGKPSHVYDKDFVKHKDAKPFDSLSWKEYRKMFPRKWIPGFHAPVDPIGAALAEKKGIKAVIINGRDLKNFEKAILGYDFVGTIIS